MTTTVVETPQDIIQNLLVALKAAKEHLEYTSYGDSWERECAGEAQLAELLNFIMERYDR